MGEQPYFTHTRSGTPLCGDIQLPYGKFEYLVTAKNTFLTVPYQETERFEIGGVQVAELQSAFHRFSRTEYKWATSVRTPVQAEGWEMSDDIALYNEDADRIPSSSIPGIGDLKETLLEAVRKLHGGDPDLLRAAEFNACLEGLRHAEAAMADLRGRMAPLKDSGVTDRTSLRKPIVRP